MRLELMPHPTTPCNGVTGLWVEAARPAAARLSLGYRLEGRLAGLRLAPPAAPKRADGLWRHTCFEAFMRAGASADYLELNLAPSTEWASYRFEGYRTGMAPAADIESRIEVRQTADMLAVDAMVIVSEAMASLPWAIGISAVIEAADGRISYWALTHPPGQPDFHHAASFALELPGASAS